MWSDNEADFDLLDVRHLVAAVTTSVNDERLLPLTFGVYGAWGSESPRDCRSLQRLRLES